MSKLSLANFPDLNKDNIPRHIAIEGPIGVGKTSLTKRLADTFNYQTMLEEAETNPFLERFYQDRKANALPTQLHFLIQRIRQLESLRQSDIFQQVRISDYLIEKDPLFAQVTLDEDEFRLYSIVYEQMIPDLPTPDLVIYLQASTDTLIERVQKRGLAIERTIDTQYLKTLNDAYTHFFHYYDSAPLLIVNTEEINLADSEQDYENFVRYLFTVKSGKHYYNPQPIL